MNIKNHKWILMPVCLVLGLVMLFAFVKASQSYLSDYFNENSKEFVGKNVDLERIAEHLQDERIKAFAKDHPEGNYVLAFWSMTCAPCLKDLPSLTTAGANTLVIPINTDVKESLEDAHKAYSELVASDLPFLHDANRILQNQLRIKYLPTHVYLNAKGEITEHKVGTKF